MTNIQAAIGLAQIQRIKEIFEQKERVYDQYKKRLKDTVIFQKEPSGSVHSKWAVTIRVKNRDNVVKALSQEGIETRRVFIPLPMLPPYKEDMVLYPNALALYNEGITLPSFSELTNGEIGQICDIILRSM